MELNRERVHQRDLVLFNEPYDESKYAGGIRHFSELYGDDLQELFRLGVIDPRDAQNCCPNVTKIAAFLKDHKNFSAHGYAVSKKRDDYRVSLEGVACGPGYSMQDVWDFFRLFKAPDEFRVDELGMRCWYD